MVANYPTQTTDTVFNFKDKVVVITGGVSGIGRATAEMFAKADANVAVLDLDDTEGKVFAEDVGMFIHTDVSHEIDVARAIQTVVATFERIDVLVNNAGIEFNDRGNLIDMPREDMRRIIEVNLFGYINMVRACVPHMRPGSKIVNVSSVQGLAAHAPGTSYQIAKSSILGLTHSLAIELAPKGINVNTVIPGAIKTEGMGAVRASSSSILDPYRRRIPLARRGWAAEVAGPILFLSSSLANYMTGSTLVVDGGYLINLTPDMGGEVPTHGQAEDPDL
ncbi:SDR family oxidoreductase [Candidatus Kaiserbacteria bacterium]|nr:SDR family oxidoreductase [Candidatus Kaiserbacteria bacterium]